MREINPPDDHHVKAAYGWFELEDLAEAGRELDRVSPAFQAHTYVLSLRWAICAWGARWEACLEIGDKMVRLAPEWPEGWLNRSYALRELNRTKEAFELLLPALETFPTNWLIPCKLACYACKLGNTQEATKFLGRAFSNEDPEVVKVIALDDPDLEPLWPEIEVDWGRAGF